MEKLLIMCEGPNEKEIINILLKNDCLKFTEDNLTWFNPISCQTNKNFRTG